jgi:hypothetical protein
VERGPKILSLYNQTKTYNVVKASGVSPKMATANLRADEREGGSDNTRVSESVDVKSKYLRAAKNRGDYFAGFPVCLKKHIT